MILPKNNLAKMMPNNEPTDVDIFRANVTNYLPVTESDHVKKVINFTKWVNEMTIYASLRCITDSVVNREYSRALAIYCAHGPPPKWTIKAIDKIIYDLNHLHRQSFSTRILTDTHQNIKFHKYIAKRDFCLRLLGDLFAVIDAHHLSST